MRIVLTGVDCRVLPGVTAGVQGGRAWSRSSPQTAPTRPGYWTPARVCPGRSTGRKRAMTDQPELDVTTGRIDEAAADAEVQPDPDVAEEYAESLPIDPSPDQVEQYLELAGPPAALDEDA